MSGIALALASAGSVVKLTEHTVTATAFTGSTAFARFGLRDSGEAYRRINAASAIDYPGEWFAVAPVTGIGSDFEARATLTSGTLDGGPTGAWGSLSAGAEWYVSRNISGTKACTFTLEIRRAGSTHVLASAPITVSAFWEP